MKVNSFQIGKQSRELKDFYICSGYLTLRNESTAKKKFDPVREAITKTSPAHRDFAMEI